MNLVPEVKRLLGLSKKSDDMFYNEDAEYGPIGPVHKDTPLPPLSASVTLSDEEAEGFAEELLALETKARAAGSSVIHLLVRMAQHEGLDLR